ncbi:protein of unknown function [Cupriavidus taiwanensis]|nr:protein of unknown function [Cupriavidus taiwanensis]
MRVTSLRAEFTECFDKLEPALPFLALYVSASAINCL